MDPFATTVLIGAGSAAGGYCRHAIVRALTHRYAPDFPWPTLLVNATGSLLAGALVLGLVDGLLTPTGHALAVAGFCGGYTTVSAFALDTLYLFRRRRIGLALVNVAATLGATVAGASIGFRLMGGWLG